MVVLGLAHRQEPQISAICVDSLSEMRCAELCRRRSAAQRASRRRSFIQVPKVALVTQW